MKADERLTYAEADYELLKRVQCFLHQRGHRLQQRLEISIGQGIVVVQGRMPTFYLRQIAVECIKRVAGVTQVVDLIKVVDGPVQPQATDSPVVEQESPAESTRHREDGPDMAGTAKDASLPDFRRRHLISSTK